MSNDIPVDQLGQRLTEALAAQRAHEVIPLTTVDGTAAWVLKVPEEFGDSVADSVLFTEGPGGRVVAVVQAEHAAPEEANRGSPLPVFGAGQGTLTIVSEDDEHLADFREYMG